MKVVSVEKIRAAQATYRARLAALPDPDDEAIPRRREELEKERRKLSNILSQLDNSAQSVATIDVKSADHAAAVERWTKIETNLNAELAAAKTRREVPGQHWSLQRELDREIAALGEALAAVDGGWESFAGVGTVMPIRLWDALKAAGVDPSRARRRSFHLAMIQELEREREMYIDRVRAHLNATPTGAAAGRHSRVADTPVSAL